MWIYIFKKRKWTHSTGDFFFLSHSKGDFFFFPTPRVTLFFFPTPRVIFFLKTFYHHPPGYLMVRPLGIYIYSMSGPLRLAALNQK